jgi:hypothetical protein
MCKYHVLYTEPLVVGAARRENLGHGQMTSKQTRVRGPRGGHWQTSTDVCRWPADRRPGVRRIPAEAAARPAPTRIRVSTPHLPVRWCPSTGLTATAIVNAGRSLPVGWWGGRPEPGHGPAAGPRRGADGMGRPTGLRAVREIRRLARPRASARAVSGESCTVLLAGPGGEMTVSDLARPQARARSEQAATTGRSAGSGREQSTDGAARLRPGRMVSAVRLAGRRMMR